MKCLHPNSFKKQKQNSISKCSLPGNFPNELLLVLKSDTFAHESLGEVLLLKDLFSWPGCDMHSLGGTMLYIVQGIKQVRDRYVLDCIGW